MTKEKNRSRSKVAVAARSLSPEPKITNMFTHGSHGGIDDEYYINEIIGLDDFTYDDWIGKKWDDKEKAEQREWIRLHHAKKKQREEKKKDEYFTNSFGVRVKRQK